MTSLLKMPLVGFGLWKVPKAQASETVYTALKNGYRLLDGAGDYGNEKECGEGLTRAINEGIVKRSEVFVVSKVSTTLYTPPVLTLNCLVALEHFPRKRTCYSNR